MRQARVDTRVTATTCARTEHASASEVGDEIVTATVRNPQGVIVGFLYNLTSLRRDPARSDREIWRHRYDQRIAQ
jgi:hypothetical protein